MRKSAIVFSSIVLGSLLVFVMVYLFEPHLVNKGFNYLKRKVKNTIWCKDYNQAVFSSKLNDKISDYISISCKSGIPECQEDEALKAWISKGTLVPVSTGHVYIVDKLHYSRPYLTYRTRLLLDELDKRFSEEIKGTKLKNTKFIITSMTRTTELNNELRRKNHNTSKVSPHLNGNAVDLTYARFKSHRFFLTQCDMNYLKESLAEVIWRLTEEKKCWATTEYGQNCFHIVAR